MVARFNVVKCIYNNIELTEEGESKSFFLNTTNKILNLKIRFLLLN
jgi:hypothetical protein